MAWVRITRLLYYYYTTTIITTIIITLLLLLPLLLLHFWLLVEYIYFKLVSIIFYKNGDYLSMF